MSNFRQFPAHLVTPSLATPFTPPELGDTANAEPVDSLPSNQAPNTQDGSTSSGPPKNKRGRPAGHDPSNHVPARTAVHAESTYRHRIFPLLKKLVNMESTYNCEKESSPAHFRFAPILLVRLENYGPRKVGRPFKVAANKNDAQTSGQDNPRVVAFIGKLPKKQVAWFVEALQELHDHMPETGSANLVEHAGKTSILTSITCTDDVDACSKRHCRPSGTTNDDDLPGEPSGVQKRGRPKKKPRPYGDCLIIPEPVFDQPTSSAQARRNFKKGGFEIFKRVCRLERTCNFPGAAAEDFRMSCLLLVRAENLYGEGRLTKELVAYTGTKERREVGWFLSALREYQAAMPEAGPASRPPGLQRKVPTEHFGATATFTAVTTLGEVEEVEERDKDNILPPTGKGRGKGGAAAREVDATDVKQELGRLRQLMATMQQQIRRNQQHIAEVQQQLGPIQQQLQLLQQVQQQMYVVSVPGYGRQLGLEAPPAPQLPPPSDHQALH